jgi:hypothetical protein
MDYNLRPRVSRTENYYAVLAGASPRKRKVYPSPKTTFVIGAESLQKPRIPQRHPERQIANIDMCNEAAESDPATEVDQMMMTMMTMMEVIWSVSLSADGPRK